ncbi:MAG: hypothetical protein J6W39_01515 [Spirochaetales bacterium]|nr:hypothetical protein [Spirochaetales bacterium]
MQFPNKYITDLHIAPSQVDFSNRLGYYETFRLFMDMANAHASILGCDLISLMSRGLFWLTVKTRISFERRPSMGQSVQAQTWPLKPTSLRTDRCYRLLDKDGILAEGRTEWAVMDLKAMKLAPLFDIFPKDFEFNQEDFSIQDFPRIIAADDSYTVKNTYKVNSSDIDMGLHMNNTAYVRALLGAFSVEELKKKDIKEITVIFKTSAHEGDVLSMKEKSEGNITNCGLYFEDSKPSLLAQLVY